MLKEKILIVEDEPETYYRLERIFNEKGMQVLAHPAGGIIPSYEAATAVLEEEIPDIALLDIQLSGDMNGIDLGIMLKRIYDIPVLYLSNHPNDRNIDRIAAAGQFGFVVKKALLESDEQLWTSFKLEQARIMQSAILHAPEDGMYLQCTQKISLENKNPVIWKVSRVKRFFYWDNITVITIEKKGSKNHVLIQEDNSKYGYIINDSLTKIEQMLPPRFIRINDHEILNTDKITAFVRSHVYTADPDECPDDKSDQKGDKKNSSKNDQKLEDKIDIPGRKFTISREYREKFVKRINLLNRKAGK